MPNSSSKQPGSDFYKLADGSSKQTLTSFSLPTVSNKSGSSRKHRRGSRDNSLLPHSYKTHLSSLFREIETEFENLYLENVRLKEQINEMEKACIDNTKLEADDADGFDINVIKSFTKKNFPKTRHKLKAQTSKIVSSFKNQGVVSWCPTSVVYRGHKDGIWDVSVGGSVLGTASADRTARLWLVDSGKSVMRYGGHEGSVNSLKFHPCQELVITGSGDGTAHVWVSKGGLLASISCYFDI